jgi:translation initiation factor IF-1
MTNKPDIFEVEGEVTETLPNLMFRVHVNSGPAEMVGKTILATLSGKMKMYRIRVMLGDNVKLEVSKYDMTKGRVTFRTK